MPSHVFSRSLGLPIPGSTPNWVWHRAKGPPQASSLVLLPLPFSCPPDGAKLSAMSNSLSPYSNLSSVDKSCVMVAPVESG